MPRKRDKLEEIVAKLRQFEALICQGHSVAPADHPKPPLAPPAASSYT